MDCGVQPSCTLWTIFVLKEGTGRYLALVAGTMANHHRDAHPSPDTPRSKVSTKEGIMKAIVYHRPHDVSVDNVGDPRIEKPTDVLARITTTKICGSDPPLNERPDAYEQRALRRAQRRLDQGPSSGPAAHRSSP
jgi:hypothetical protein